MIKILDNKLVVLFLAPFLLGAITTFGYSPYNITILNFFTFSSILYLVLFVKNKIKSKYRNKKKTYYLFYLGCSFGFGFFLLGNYWLSVSLTHDQIFKKFIPFAIILIPLFLSLFFGLAILICSYFAEKKISFIIYFSLIFSTFEFLRGNILTGFPWNLISYTWSWSLEIIQILSFIGAYSLSLISITLFCVPFLFFQKKILKKNIIFTALFITFFGLNYLFGTFSLNNKYKFDEDTSIKIVSPNFSIEDYKTKNEIDILKRLIEISNPKNNKKTLFIWPEGIFYESYLQDIKNYKNIFQDKFSKNHLIIFGVTNFIMDESSGNKKYFNSLVVVNNNLDILSIYNKINLVPFGEFLPFEKTLSKFGFKKITSGYNSFSSGDQRELINLGNIMKDIPSLSWNNKLILPLICYEIIYSGKIKNKSQLPDLVINISEDAWFGKSIGPQQHFAKAIFRSIEEGIFIARSANKGFSAFINPKGKVIKSLNTGESGNIELDFPHFNKKTLFSNFGNKIFFLIIFLYILLFLIFRKFKI